MWGMLGREAPDESPKSPRGRAVEILQRAFRAEVPEEVVELARSAIELWPDCADAFVLLAEHASSPKAALAYYVQGVEAGARDIGPAGFGLATGHFWGLLPTRPYMRARLGQAQMLWMMGRRDESVDHYQQLLQLNPNDNQGVRYLLAAALLELGRDEELAELLRLYEEDASACWAYSAALLAFRREGATPHARALLDTARRVNRHVPQYLTGQRHLPTRLPDGIIRGDHSEAVDYAVGFLNGWRATPGALEWLGRADSRRREPARPKKPRAAKGATPTSKARIRRLTVSEDVWQADFRQLPVWVNVGDRPQRPWIVVVANLTDGFILGQQVCEQEPTAEALWDELDKIMRAPSEGNPRRPVALELGDGEAWRAIAPELESVGI
ncbi:MAG: hypothetical protein K2X91_01950, partial [Thermoleophilia bacterium]|nr:hypothetical protein [Thermoleophilia bacterium]